MARIRTIKPEFWAHEILSALPESTHILAAALLNHADDEGYFLANPMLVKAACSPCREPSVSIHDSLKSLASIGYIRTGCGSDGRAYGHVVEFDKHQRVNRKTPSKIKEIEVVWDNSLMTHAQLTELLRQEQGTGKGTGKGGKEAEDPPTAAEKPAVDQIFGFGLDFMKSKGMSDGAARGFLGGMRKDVGDDMELLSMIIDAEQKDVIDPKAWLKAACKRKKNGSGLGSLGEVRPGEL